MFKLVTKNADILYNSNSLSWNSDADTLGTQLSFDSIKNLCEGQVVSLYEGENELIRGIIIEKYDKKNTYNYVVQDYSFYLKNKLPIVQFNKQSADSCIEHLISDTYLIGSISEIPTEITQIYRGQSKADIIDDILQKSEADQGKKYIREIEGNKLFIYELQDLKIVPNVIVGKFDIYGSIENMKNDIQVISSEEKYNSIVASATDESLYYWYGQLTDTITVDANNIAQAQNIALNKLKELNKVERSTTIPLVVLDEKVEIKANRLIYLNNSKLTGYYFIKSAKHTLANGLHKCDIDITFDYTHTNVTSQYENSNLINQIISDSASNNSSSSSSSSGGSYSSNEVVNKALQWALDTANDNNVGYQLGAWGPNYYDCSHFVITAYRKAGLSLSGASYTGDMYNSFLSEGFKDVTSSCNLSSGDGMQAGDVLLNTQTHTEMYSGSGKMVGARTAKAQKEEQVEEHNYNNHPWNYVLRYGG